MFHLKDIGWGARCTLLMSLCSSNRVHSCHSPGHHG